MVSKSCWPWPTSISVRSMIASPGCRRSSRAAWNRRTSCCTGAPAPTTPPVGKGLEGMTMDNNRNFENRTVIVTGAAGNLGRAVAQAFAERGASLALIDLHADALEQVYGAAESSRLLVPLDLLDRDAVDAAAGKIEERFGRIDVLCNIAGGFRMGEAVHETSARTWDFLMDINARTLLHASAAVVPRMLKAGGGRIVNVGAYAAAQKGVAHMGAYTAAKSAVIRLTEAMSAELR